MPSSSLKVLAKRAGMKLADAEKKWNKAKQIVSKEYDYTYNDPEYWALVTTITKRMIGFGEGAEKITFKQFISEAREDKIYHPSVKGAYALVDYNFVWNAGSEFEFSIPTLEMVFVPAKQRGKGVGKDLIKLILDEMKKRKIPVIAFDNFDRDFWDSAKREFPDNIDFTGAGKLKNKWGILRLDKSSTAKQIFN